VAVAADETSVERTLGRLEAHVEALVRALEDHTEADASNFQRLETHLLRVEDKLDGAPPAPKASARAATWGATAAAVVAGIVEALRQLAG
jgi:hypothetical protein